MDFQIETTFAPHPRTYRGVCEACGCDSETDEHRPVVQISSISIDHDDGLYTGLWLCGGCVRQIGRALGMIDVAQADRLHEEASRLALDLEEARSEIARLRPVRDALAAVAAQVVEEDSRVPCPECGKLVKEQGLGAHQRLAHRREALI